MIRPVDFLPVAQREVEEAFRWHEFAVNQSKRPYEMEIQDVLQCPKCSRTMVKIGGRKRDEEMVMVFYHCHGCYEQLTVDAMTGAHGGKFTDETLEHFNKCEVLRVFGFVAIPGDRYPWSRVPEPERVQPWVVPKALPMEPSCQP